MMPPRPPGAPGSARWLRIRVTDVNTGRSKASVQIPLALVDAGMKIGAHFAPEVAGVDMSNVLAALRAGMTGKIIDVTAIGSQALQGGDLIRIETPGGGGWGKMS